MKPNREIKSIFIILIIGAILVLVSIVILIFATGTLENDKPLYGEFTYLNDDGTEAKIILSEESAYFENVDFDTMEGAVATFASLNELKTNGEEYTQEKHEELRQIYLDKIDLEGYYNGKEYKYDDIKCIKDEGQYYYFYYLYYPGIGEYGVDICVDLESKSLSIADMEFQYIK